MTLIYYLTRFSGERAFVEPSQTVAARGTQPDSHVGVTYLIIQPAMHTLYLIEEARDNLVVACY